MTDIKPSTTRDAVNTRIAALGLTRYQFAHSQLIDAAPSTVYRFLNGDVESSSGNLDEMLTALGLRIVPAVRPMWARKAKRLRDQRLKTV